MLNELQRLGVGSSQPILTPARVRVAAELPSPGASGDLGIGPASPQAPWLKAQLSCLGACSDRAEAGSICVIYDVYDICIDQSNCG
jgi:hypothetical protein